VIYKRKKVEKTLYMSLHICYIGDKKMRIVQVGNSRYYIQDEDDLVSLVHQLVSEGYSLSQIANFLNVSERKVRNMLNDCW